MALDLSYIDQSKQGIHKEHQNHAESNIHEKIKTCIVTYFIFSRCILVTPPPLF